LVLAEVEDALGVVAQNFAGIGKAGGATAAHKQALADPILQAADGEADGGLGAVELVGGAGEAFLAGDGQEGVQLHQVHRSLITIIYLSDNNYKFDFFGRGGVS
jgi:hypothetical protein